MLPDVADPGELVRQLRERSPATAIVLISNMPPSDLRKHAERLGADGWMPKAQKPEQLRGGGARRGRPARLSGAAVSRRAAASGRRSA